MSQLLQKRPVSRQKVTAKVWSRSRSPHVLRWYFHRGVSALSHVASPSPRLAAWPSRCLKNHLFWLQRERWFMCQSERRVKNSLYRRIWFIVLFVVDIRVALGIFQADNIDLIQFKYWWEDWVWYSHVNFCRVAFICKVMHSQTWANLSTSAFLENFKEKVTCSNYEMGMKRPSVLLLPKLSRVTAVLSKSCLC